MSAQDLPARITRISGWPLWKELSIQGYPTLLATLPLKPHQISNAQTTVTRHTGRINEAVSRAGYSASPITFLQHKNPGVWVAFLAINPPRECLVASAASSLSCLLKIMERPEPKETLRELFKLLVLPLSPSRIFSYITRVQLCGENREPDHGQICEIKHVASPFRPYPTCAEMLADKKLPAETRETACRIIPALAYTPGPRIR